LKSEPLVQEKFQGEKAFDKRIDNDDNNNNNNNNNNKGSRGMGEVAPLYGVDSALVLTNPGVQ